MRWVVPKQTMTYAETLQAVGLGSLLEEITGSEVRLVDGGERYVLESEELPPYSEWPRITPGYPFIFLKADGTMPPGEILDYEREREKAKRLQEFRKAAGTQKGKMASALQEQGGGEPPKPVSEYKMASFLASMRKGWVSDKHLFLWIQANSDNIRAWVSDCMGIAESPDTSTDVPKISNSQVFNPISGKGVHRPKPDSTAPGSISSEVVDPFAEWMKFRGAYRCMLPYRHDKGFKVMVIEPTDIIVSHLAILYSRLRELDLWGGIRLDIESTLRLTEILILHSDVMGNQIPLRNRLPREVVRGLHQAYFQSLGTAAALMNYHFTAMPSWFPIHDRDDANAFLGIIREHIGDRRGEVVAGCLSSLEEKRSGDVPVLQQYRKWLTTGQIRDFLDFCYGFALHQIQRRSQDKWVKMMTTENLNILFGRGYKMLDIVENQGFQNVAKAIRNATVYALMDSKQKKGGRREVRFGLAQQWKQKIKGGNDEFVAALGDFVQQYNWESENLDAAAKDRPAGGWKSHKVNAGDLDQVIRLIYGKGDKGAELVGMLLLAYGYARTPKADATEAEPEATNEEGISR
ncbi:MAG: hypothetical protein M0028_05875 [Clostridia bacterium]|nr:hypothetical protein [Clostridia bacterium]